MGLTREEKRFYEENGYLLKKRLVSSEDITRIQEEIEDIHNRMSAAPTEGIGISWDCLLYTSPSPRDRQKSRMPSSA